MGKKLDILFPDDSREASMDLIRKTSLGERWDVVEIPIINRDGTVHIVLWNSATLYDRDNKSAMATIAQGQDITERKQAEDRLELYAEELESANKELEAFSYSVSHDLRAPLRTLDGFSEAALSEYGDKLDETGKDYLNRVRKASQTMSQLIDAMLILSRVSRTEMNVDEVNLSDLAQSFAEELKTSEPERKTEIVIASGLKVHGDRRLLRILLQNLLENAWKFTRKSPVAKIELGIIEKNGERVYFIRDNGVGFDMKFSHKLFQPFQRLHSGEEFSGTGIGLASVQRVINRHGGRIWAEAEIGKGATFYFSMGRL